MEVNRPTYNTFCQAEIGCILMVWCTVGARNPNPSNQMPSYYRMFFFVPILTFRAIAIDIAIDIYVTDFSKLTIHNGGISLGRFIRNNFFSLVIKWSRLTAILKCSQIERSRRQSDHLKSECARDSSPHCMLYFNLYFRPCI